MQEEFILFNVDLVLDFQVFRNEVQALEIRWEELVTTRGLQMLEFRCVTIARLY